MTFCLFQIRRQKNYLDVADRLDELASSISRLPEMDRDLIARPLVRCAGACGAAHAAGSAARCGFYRLNPGMVFTPWPSQPDPGQAAQSALFLAR